MGPRDSAMGNAGAGLASDFGAVYYNPAGLTQARGTTLIAGTRFVDPDLNIELGAAGGGRLDFDYPSTELQVFGMTTDLGFLNPRRGSFVDRLSLGMAISIGGDLKSFTTYPTTSAPSFFRYSDKLVGLFPVGLGLGFRVTDWFSIGAAFFTAPSDTFTDVIALADIQVGGPDGVTQVVRQGVTTRAFAKIEPVIGAMFKLPFWDLEDKVQIGITWRDEISSIDGEGIVSNIATIEIGGQVIQLPEPTIIDIKQLAGFSPRQLLIGLGLRPWTGASFAIDFIWKDWSAWQNFDQAKPENRFHDTYQVRFGAEYIFPAPIPYLHTIALRGGYYFEPTPAPDQDGFDNILDNDKHVISGGMGVTFFDPFGLFDQPISINGSLQAHLLIERSTKNDQDPNFGRFEAGGHLLGGQVTLELNF